MKEYRVLITYNYFGRMRKEEVFTDVSLADNFISDHLKRHGSIGLKETVDGLPLVAKWSYGRPYRRNLQKFLEKQST